MISLPAYAKIKDCYCIGCSPEILEDLIKARKIIEKELPGLRLYICCEDEKIIGIQEERMVPRSRLEFEIKNFAYFRELKKETAEDILKESNII